MKYGDGRPDTCNLLSKTRHVRGMVCRVIDLERTLILPYSFQEMDEFWRQATRADIPLCSPQTRAPVIPSFASHTCCPSFGLGARFGSSMGSTVKQESLKALLCGKRCVGWPQEIPEQLSQALRFCTGSVRMSSLRCVCGIWDMGNERDF